jgi:ubiquinone/menaquinone biosynthesis C-methylase UbiE
MTKLEKSPAVEKRIAKWYADNYYSVEDEIIPLFEKMETPFLDKRIKPGMHLFDAMMGRGRHALRYAKRGCKVWGNDLNPYMVAHVRKAAKHLKVKPRLTVLDATSLRSVKSSQFDVVIAMYSALGTIPQAKNRQKAMNEFARVCKPGGVVIIHAHNRLDTFLKPAFWDWIIEGWLGRHAPGDMVTSYNNLDDMYNHFYTPGEFRNSFAKAGLKVAEEAYMHYPTKRWLKGPLRKLKADGFIFVAIKE